MRSLLRTSIFIYLCVHLSLWTLDFRTGYIVTCSVLLYLGSDLPSLNFQFKVCSFCFGLWSTTYHTFQRRFQKPQDLKRPNHL